MTGRVRLVLVRPKEDGNVGAAARIARNFGATEIVLVRPRAAVGEEARRRAMGGLALLRSARRAPDLARAVHGSDLVVGTTDLAFGRSTAYLRRTVSPERLGEVVAAAEGTIAVVFGPEDNGLTREELTRCDLLVHVPARREFPTLNLSHAVAVVLYAVHRAQGPADPASTPAPESIVLNGREKELLLERVGALAVATGYPAHKRRGLILLFRRVLGRSTPSEAEYRMMLGLFSGFEHALGRRRKEGGGGKR